MREIAHAPIHHRPCARHPIGAGPAAAQRYEALTTDTERLQQLFDAIRDLIDKVDRARARAADPRFVRDARSVLGRYDNPWRVPLVVENFRDDHFTRNPGRGCSR